MSAKPVPAIWHCTLGAAHSWGSVVVRGQECHFFEDAECMAALWGRVGFADERFAAVARAHGPARALADAYRAKKSGFLPQLRGTFALAVLARGGSGVLAVDRTGTYPLYYTDQSGQLSFATTLDAFTAMPGLTLTPSVQAIYEYLYFHMVPGPLTIYEGCERLLPGTFLEWNGRSTTPEAYWQIEFTEDGEQPLPQLKTAFRSLLERSVAEAAGDGATVGAFLSGGTDSSTVAGLLSRVVGAPARTYSIGFDAHGYDEMAYARIAARHFRTDHHEYYVTPQDVVDAIPVVVQAHGEPFGNSSAVPAYYCAKLAMEDGVRTMLAGDGGDELFGGNQRYATQYLYSLYGELPERVRRVLIEPVAFLFREDRPILGKARRYIQNASIPMPARYDRYNLVEHFGAEAIFSSDFLAGVRRERPALAMEQVYWGQRAQSMVNRMLGFDLKYTLADSDLPKVVQACESAGVAARFPLLDDALVEFSARLPSRLKVRTTQLRYFFKEALRDFLPAEIIRKAKHGFGLPFGTWMVHHDLLRQVALDSLTDLKARRIVRPDFIDALCSQHVNENAPYYGTMVWVLMMLEQWFKLHTGPRDRSSGFARSLELAA